MANDHSPALKHLSSVLPFDRDDAANRRQVAIVGAGPTGLYTLRHLIEAAQGPVQVDIFEQGRDAGAGTPYSEAMNVPVMLSNIASRELPPLIQPLHEWLSALPGPDLASLGVAPDEITDDAFFPRLTLGAYFTAQFAEVMARARARGHIVELHLRHRVTDVRPEAKGIAVDWREPSGTGTTVFDDVVISTGHHWPDAPANDGVRALLPWPAEKIARLPQRRIGVLGSSLSAIDVAVVIAHARGRFGEEGDVLHYEARPGRDDFRITLMSRKGLLPEADYWYELPLPELPTLADLAGESEDESDGTLLEAAFQAFLTDLAQAAPDRSGILGGRAATREGFHDAYFRERMSADPFEWAARNLEEAARNKSAARPVPWRSALLRAHELFEILLPRFTEAEVDDFLAALKPVFTDCYACVPHASIRRLLALHEAGHLDVLRLGDDASFDTGRDGTVSARGIDGAAFEVLIDARGQARFSLDDLGFPSLTSAALSTDTLRFDGFVLPLRAPTRGRVHCLALPVLLRRRPFVQGLVNADEMGRETAAAIAGAMSERN